MHYACSNPFAPIAETTGDICGSRHAQPEASPDSVGDSEGASAEPVVGAVAMAVQPVLVEKSKQVLALQALPGAPRPAAVSRATRWLEPSTMIRTHARPGRARSRTFLEYFRQPLLPPCTHTHPPTRTHAHTRARARTHTAASRVTVCLPIRSHRPSPSAHHWAAWRFRAILCRAVSRLVCIVQLARPAFGWCCTILTLLSMLLVVALCTTSALFSPGKQAIGASPCGGWVGGGSWSVDDSSAAELLTMKVRSDWPSIGHRRSAVVSTGRVCAALTHTHPCPVCRLDPRSFLPRSAPALLCACRVAAVWQRDDRKHQRLCHVRDVRACKARPLCGVRFGRCMRLQLRSARWR
jgi:hypothetical protein